MTGPPRPLTERERAALAAACDAFHPSLAPEGTDDPTLFSASATSLGVPRAAEDAIDMLAPADRRALLRLLRLLEGPLLGLTIGKPRRLSAMTPADRDRLLRSMSTSRIPPLRSGFQALRRLSSFLYYSTTDKTGHNAVWPRIGYTPSPRGAVGASSVRSMRYDTDATVDCDVCVVGSGAGGGTVAGELSTRGYKVVLIESGPGDQAPNFSQGELDGTRRLYLDSGLTATRDLGVAILAGSCLGGRHDGELADVPSHARLHPRRMGRAFGVRAVHERPIQPGARHRRDSPRRVARRERGESEQRGDSARLRVARLRLVGHRAKRARLRHRAMRVLRLRLPGRGKTVDRRHVPPDRASRAKIRDRHRLPSRSPDHRAQSCRGRHREDAGRRRFARDDRNPSESRRRVRGWHRNAYVARALWHLAAAARTEPVCSPDDGGRGCLRRSHRSLARTSAVDHVRRSSSASRATSVFVSRRRPRIRGFSRSPRRGLRRGRIAG